MEWKSSGDKYPPHKQTVLISHNGQYLLGHFDKFTRHFHINAGNSFSLDKNEFAWTEIVTPPKT